MLRVLAVERAVEDPAEPLAEPPSGAPLVDPDSGLTIEPGRLTCLVSASPDETSALADRLGRLVDDCGVMLGDTPLDRLPLEIVRRRILVSEPDPLIFSGTLRSELDPWRRSSDDEITEAIEVAAAEDVLVALASGLDEVVDERGRSFSGGQRQRLVLVRALLSGAEILVLVEPTSAVDAHTEARIARQLHDYRAGRTTVIVTASPLVLDRADTVVLIADGRVQASGTHRELLRTSTAYRDVVTRGEAGMSKLLPIASPEDMRRQAAILAGRHRRAMIGVLVLHALAAATGLVGPPLLGSLVQGLQTEIDTAEIDRVVLILAVFLVAQTILTFFARRASFVLSEQMFAELRDDFMRRVLALPLSTVERAGIGDLVSRTTADVDALARTVRFAIPETSIACVTALLVVGAAVWVSPIAALRHRRREQRLRLHDVPGRQVLRLRPAGAREHLPVVPARRQDRRARAERGRQVDAAADHGRPRGAVVGDRRAAPGRDRRLPPAGARARPGQGRPRQRRGRRPRAP